MPTGSRPKQTSKQREAERVAKEKIRAKQRRKRERRKEVVRRQKAAARQRAEEARLRGDPPPRKCHICHGEHWVKECPNYGKWKAGMERRKAEREGGASGDEGSGMELDE